MKRVIAIGLAATAMTAGTPASARGLHGFRLFGGHAQHGHPINAWLGNRRMHLR